MTYLGVHGTEVSRVAYASVVAEVLAAVEVAGLTTTTKTTSTVHVHPLVKVERESRAQFTKLWAGLTLHHEYAAGDR